MNRDNKYILDLLTKINSMLRSEKKLCDVLDSNGRRHLVEKHGSWMLHWQATLDVVYEAFVGKLENEVYNSYRSCSYDKNKKVPIAWYQTTWSQHDDGSILGPVFGRKKFRGFIPDAINEVICSRKISPRKKLEILEIMFRDLERLK